MLGMPAHSLVSHAAPGGPPAHAAGGTGTCLGISSLPGFHRHPWACTILLGTQPHVGTSQEASHGEAEGHTAERPHGHRHKRGPGTGLWDSGRGGILKTT